MKVHTKLRSGEAPYGSYRESCVDEMQFDPEKRVLSGECEKPPYGFLRWSSVVVPLEYQDILNCNGFLEINQCKDEDWWS